MGPSAYRTSAEPPHPVRPQSGYEVVLALTGAVAAILLVHSAFHGATRPVAGPLVAGGSEPGTMSAPATHFVTPRATTPTSAPSPRASGRRLGWQGAGAPDVGLDLRPVHNEVTWSRPSRGPVVPSPAAPRTWAPPPAVDTGYLRPSHASWSGLHFGKGH